MLAVMEWGNLIANPVREMFTRIMAYLPVTVLLRLKVRSPVLQRPLPRWAYSSMQKAIKAP